jgi:hypothetical protein
VVIIIANAVSLALLFGILYFKPGTPGCGLDGAGTVELQAGV